MYISTIYSSGPFKGSAVCESRFFYGLHYGFITVGTFAIKMSSFFSFFFWLGFSVLCGYLQRQREVMERKKKKKKKRTIER